MSESVDYSLYLAKLREFAAVTRKAWPAVLRGEGRLMAVSLARSTQPYTRGEDWATSQAQGQAKVDRDVRKVYATGGDVFEAIHGTDEGLADAFYYFYETGQHGGKRGAQSLMEASKTPFKNLRIAKLDPAHHKAARGRGGRVGGSGKRFKQVVKSVAELVKFSTAKQKLVGFAKGGWAACARFLGGVRGIPGWVTRQSSPGSVRDNSQSETFPFVELTNNVRYADQALDTRAENEAYRIGKDRLVKQIDIVLQKAAEKFKRAA